MMIRNRQRGRAVRRGIASSVALAERTVVVRVSLRVWGKDLHQVTLCAADSQGTLQRKQLTISSMAIFAAGVTGIEATERSCDGHL
jgi:hypothetical protein